jgi:hypothetical protein
MNLRAIDTLRIETMWPYFRLQPMVLASQLLKGEGTDGLSPASSERKLQVGVGEDCIHALDANLIHR